MFPVGQIRIFNFYNKKFYCAILRIFRLKAKTYAIIVLSNPMTQGVLGMNIEKIKCFVDIVKFNSFTKAAQENYVTQAAISQQISSMEAELGFQLFERSKRGFTVTPAGKSFYDSSLHLLSLYNRSLSKAKCISENLSGYISLGLWPGFNRSHIYSVIDRLMLEYPSTRIEFRTATPTELKLKHATGKLAMAVTMYYDFCDGTVPDAIIEPLATCGYRLYVSEKHRLSGRDAVTVEEIRNEPFVVLRENCMGLQTYSHIVVEQMQNHHGLEPAFVVPNFETQQMLVATNQAVMILPKLCRPNDPSCFRAIELEDYNETCTFSAVWRSANPSPVLVSLSGLLQEHFRSSCSP